MTVLIVDDEAALRRSLADYLEDLDVEVVLAADGREGLEQVKRHDVRLVFVDLNMPVMDGYAFIKVAHAQWPELPVVVLSGVGVVEDAMQAIRFGAWDFISKPITDLEIVRLRMEKNLERAELIRENRQYQEGLEKMVRLRTKELEYTRLRIIHCLGKAAEYKDNETGNHVIRVGDIAHVLALALGMTPTRTELLRHAAPMHDIGKIGIPDHILLKEGPLAEEEWRIMKQHCWFGYDILTNRTAPIPPSEADSVICSPAESSAPGENEALLDIARHIALYHHERWDGTGYSCGLKGTEIPLEARIVALADVYDALGSVRSYKPAFPEEKCQAILAEGRGSHFDPSVVEAFFSRIEDILAIKRRLKD